MNFFIFHLNFVYFSFQKLSGNPYTFTNPVTSTLRERSPQQSTVQFTNFKLTNPDLTTMSSQKEVPSQTMEVKEQKEEELVSLKQQEEEELAMCDRILADTLVSGNLPKTPSPLLPKKKGKDQLREPLKPKKGN